MKITVKQADLSRGLSTVSHAVSSRSTLPILSNILLVTDQEQGMLKLSATNLEIGITCSIPATVHEPGSTTTPAKTISDLVQSLRPVDLEIEVDDKHTMSIKGKGVSATVKGMEASEYPQIPIANAEDSNSIVNLDVRQLKEMIAYTAFSAADDDSRPVLTGVHVETVNEKLTFAAADAFRLAVMSAPLPSGEQIADTILIPAKTLTELARILPSEGQVQMIVTPNRSQVLFHTDNVDLVSRLIEGTFPNFRGIIPKKHTTRVNIDRQDALAALKSLMPFAKDSSGIVRLEIREETETEWGELILRANAEDIGSNECTLEAMVYGEANNIIFNAKYLQDVLQALKCERVALDVEYDSRPGVVRPLTQIGSDWFTDSDLDYTYVIMPMSEAK